MIISAQDFNDLLDDLVHQIVEKGEEASVIQEMIQNLKILYTDASANWELFEKQNLLNYIQKPLSVEDLPQSGDKILKLFYDKIGQIRDDFKYNHICTACVGACVTGCSNACKGCSGSCAGGCNNQGDSGQQSGYPACGNSCTGFCVSCGQGDCHGGGFINSWCSGGCFSWNCSGGCQGTWCSNACADNCGGHCRQACDMMCMNNCSASCGEGCAEMARIGVMG